MSEKNFDKKKSGPSTKLIDMAIAAFRHHHNRLDISEGNVAKLATDTQSLDERAGVRGASALRELFYSGDQMQVVLSIKQNDLGRLNTLRGQIYLNQPSDPTAKKSPEGIALSVQCLRGDTYLAIADTVGRFRLSNLDSGAYRIDIQSSDEKLVIEELMI